jgi:hypothetical protein
LQFPSRVRRWRRGHVFDLFILQEPRQGKRNLVFMLLCCLRGHKLDVRILLRSLYVTKYFKYLDCLVLVGYLDLPLISKSSALDPLQYPVALDLPEHLLHLVLLNHLDLHVGVDLEHALLGLDAAPLHGPDASLRLVPFAVRPELGIGERLLEVPIVIQSRDLFLREAMKAVLQARENLVRVVLGDRRGKEGTSDDRRCLKTRLQTQTMLGGVEG